MSENYLGNQEQDQLPLITLSDAINAFFEFSEREWNRLYYGQESKRPVGIMSEREIKKVAKAS